MSNRPNNHIAQVRVRMPRKQLALLKTEAKRTGLTVNALILSRLLQAEILKSLKEARPKP
jgi:hypothetical protein